jgi:hypothetical protein
MGILGRLLVSDQHSTAFLILNSRNVCAGELKQQDHSSYELRILISRKSSNYVSSHTQIYFQLTDGKLIERRFFERTAKRQLPSY